MNISTRLIFSAIIITSLFQSVAVADSEEVKGLLQKVMPKLSTYSTDQKVVDAVKKANTTPVPEAVSMTNDKWKTLTVLAPEVRAFAKNELAQYINSSKPEYVSELFVNAADGSKIAFITKPTSWIHKGKPKHDLPMQGKNWTGDIEVDESTGVQQIQISIPVLDGKKPIGSIVLGLSISKLKEVK